VGPANERLEIEDNLDKKFAKKYPRGGAIFYLPFCTIRIKLIAITVDRMEEPRKVCMRTRLVVELAREECLIAIFTRSNMSTVDKKRLLTLRTNS
jgi:hypothetical protein